MSIEKRGEEYQRDLGLKFDSEHMIWYGEKEGYHFVYSKDSNNYRILSISVSNGDYPQKDTMKKAKEECRAIKNFIIQGYRVNFILKKAIKNESTIEYAVEAMRYLIDFLTSKGFKNCCEASGDTGDTDFYYVGGDISILSEEEFQKISKEIKDQDRAFKEKKENLLGGIVGALLGSVIGAIAIILIFKMGYVSVLSGIIMGICTVKGYEILGGKFSKKGIVISFLVMVGMAYLSFRFSLALEIQKYSVEDFGVFEIFRMVPDIISYEDMRSYYIIELLKVEGFTLLGGIPYIYYLMKAKKEGSKAYKLGD